MPLRRLLFPLFPAHVWSSHPFRRLRAHWSRPIVCTCTSTYLQTQVSGRPGLYNEVGFIGCPCALGSPFISTTHTSVPSRPPVMSSFSCLLCAHTCTFALTLAFRLPSGRRVCVCVPLVVTGILLNCFSQQGDMACVQGPCPTKLPDARDMQLITLTYLQFSFSFSEWREAKPRASLGRQVRPSSPCRFVVDLRLWPPFLLKTPSLH